MERGAGPTSVLGRQELIDGLEERLARGAGILLVGPPGVGKTTLLDAWASESTPVSLERRERAEELLLAITHQLEVSTRATSVEGRLRSLLDAHERDRVTLALDAVDDLDPGALDVLDRLVEAGVRVVATSRVAHPLARFELVDVPPLAFPTELGPKAARSSPAGELFVQSARRVGALETLDDEAWTHIGRITRSLEGMPLALVLTATRVRALGVERLADELAGSAPSTGALAHPRLVGAVTRSLERLEERSRSLLELAAELPDGFELTELEALAGTPDVTRHLMTLVSHSLVNARPGAAPSRLRYSIHAVVREVVRERAGDARRAELEARLATFLAEQVASAGAARDVQALALHEHALQRAFDWARRHVDDPEARAIGIALARGIGRLAEAHGPSLRSRSTLELADRWADDDGADRATRAELAYFRGFVDAEGVSLRSAREHLNRALALATGGDDRHVLASVSAQLAWLAARYGEVDDAMAHRRTIEDAMNEEHDPWLALLAAALEALLTANEARHAEAREAGERWRSLAAGLGDFTHESYALGVLGCIELDAGDVTKALRLLDRSVALAQRFDTPISEGIFRGFRAIARHTAGEPDIDEYANAVGRCGQAGAVLYAGLFRAWEATARIRDGAVEEGARTLDLILAATPWPMPQKVLGALRLHVALAEARAETDPTEARRLVAGVAKKLSGFADEDLSTMIQLRLARQVLDEELRRALPEAPGETEIAVAFAGREVRLGGVREALDRHPTLARLAWALAVTRLAEPGVAVDTLDLRRLGWPDTPPTSRGSLHRLRVALSSLRRLGLSAIVHRDGGYLIDPETTVSLYAG